MKIFRKEVDIKLMKRTFVGLFMVMVMAGCAAVSGDRRADPPEISGVVMDVRREGGMLGVCQDITLMASGEMDIVSCDGENLMATPGSTLSDAQRETLLGWAGTYTSLDVSDDSQLPVDGLAYHLVFNGSGDVTPGDEVQGEMMAFVDEVYAQYGIPPAPPE